MSVTARFGLFLLITFFSGSIVVMAARDLRNNLKPPSEAEVEQAGKLVTALRGDALFEIEAKYHENHPRLSPRKIGSYLADYDVKKIKSFLIGLVGGIGEGEGAADPESSAATEDK
jgi:hypothetical protein